MTATTDSRVSPFLRAFGESLGMMNQQLDRAEGAFGSSNIALGIRSLNSAIFYLNKIPVSPTLEPGRREAYEILGQAAWDIFLTRAQKAMNYRTGEGTR